MTRRRFSIIELLIVIAILSVLASLLLPALERAKRSARQVVCMNGLKQVGVALYNYVDDYRGYLPPGINFGRGSGLDKTRLGQYFPNPKNTNWIGHPKSHELHCPEWKWDWRSHDPKSSTWWKEHMYSWQFIYNPGSGAVDRSSPFSEGGSSPWDSYYNNIGGKKLSMFVAAECAAYVDGTSFRGRALERADFRTPWQAGSRHLGIRHPRNTFNMSYLDGRVESHKDAWAASLTNAEYERLCGGQ